ncbi:MAG: hypothetical protein ACPGLV_08765 [Bacteroidia bacterium]
MKHLLISLFALLLIFMASCQKSDEAPTIDWYGAIVKKEIPFAQLNEPECFYKPFDIVFLNDPYYYEFEYDTSTIAPFNISFQDSPVKYMVYQKHEWSNDEIGIYTGHLNTYLYDLENKELTAFGKSAGGIDISGNGKIVIYNHFDEFVIYNTQTKESTSIDGFVYYFDLNCNGTKVFFQSGYDVGQFQGDYKYIYDLETNQVLYKFDSKELRLGNWLNDSILVFSKSIEPKLYSLNINTGDTMVFAKSTTGHFRVFTAVSKDGRFAYGISPYVKDLVKETEIDIALRRDSELCGNREYTGMHFMPDGQIIVKRIYYLLDSVARTAKFQSYLHVLNADGTNERRIELDIP